MPRKQLNIGLTPEQRAQVDEIATALDTTPRSSRGRPSSKPSSCNGRSLPRTGPMSWPPPKLRDCR